MNDYESSLHRYFPLFRPLLAKKRFMKPKSPEGVMYGFVFRLIYCLVALLFSIFFSFILIGISAAFFRNSEPPTYVLVGLSVITFCIPIYFGELLRYRILDLTESSADGSVVVEFSTSGLAFDRNEVLKEWKTNKKVINEIEEKATEHHSGRGIYYSYGVKWILNPINIYGFRGVYFAVGKRLVDISICLIGLIFLAPLITIIIFMIKLSDGGPSIYAHRRIGKGGKEFRLYKFRTMAIGADELLEKYLMENPEAKIEWESNRRITLDPRITKVGKVLRRMNLDSLPSILNVIIGDMSLVGPAPMVSAEAKLYPGRAYYRLKPGLTGIWQIRNHALSSYDHRARLDDLYEAHMSLSKDLSILARSLKITIKPMIDL